MRTTTPILTLLGYRGDTQVVEFDDESWAEPEAVARGLQSTLDLTRVVVLRDGRVAFDTNNRVSA